MVVPVLILRDEATGKYPARTIVRGDDEPTNVWALNVKHENLDLRDPVDMYSQHKHFFVPDHCLGWAKGEEIEIAEWRGCTVDYA